MYPELMFILDLRLLVGCNLQTHYEDMRKGYGAMNDYLARILYDKNLKWSEIILCYWTGHFSPIEQN